MAKNFTDENVKEIIATGKPVIIDFWATWCGPCMMLSPIVEELSKTYKVGKVNVDEEMELAQRFGITSIPTLLVFKGGQLVNQSLGYQSKEALEALMEV